MPQPGDVLRSFVDEEIVGKYTIRATIEHVYDPEVNKRTEEFLVRCLVDKLPELLSA